MLVVEQGVVIFDIHFISPQPFCPPILLQSLTTATITPILKLVEMVVFYLPPWQHLPSYVLF
jgi:hypothetical protein